MRFDFEILLVRKIALNSIISVVGRILATLAALVIIGAVARHLGQDGYGHYATILAFLYIFSVLADFGLYAICLREISRPGADEEKIVSNTLTLRVVLGILFFGLAPLAAIFFPYPDKVKLGITLGAVGFWFLSNTQVLMGIFQKYLRMDKVALAEVFGRILQLGLVLFFIKQNFGLQAIVLAMVGGAFLNFGFMILFARQHVRLYLDFDFSFWRKLLRESYPLAIAIVLVMIYFKLDTVMLSVMKPAGHVGIYGVAYKILESLIFLPAMFVGLIMPLMSKYALDDQEKFKNIVQKGLNVLLIFVIPMMVGVIFLSPAIISLIVGGGFGESSLVLKILIIACGIIFFGTLFSNALIALNKQKALSWIYGLGAVTNVSLNLVFIPKYTYNGAAGTTVFTELLVTALMLIVFWQTVKNLPSFKLFLKSLVATLFMAVPLYYLADWNLFILIALGAAVYLLALYLLKGFSWEGILSLVRREEV